MKLWLISQTVNSDYDTYDSAVVAAETDEDAKNTHPSSYGWDHSGGSWCRLGDVKVKLIGEATEGTEAGVLCASFNAG